MKKIRLAVISAGLVAALAAMTASAECGSVGVCRGDIAGCSGIICTERAAVPDLQIMGLQGIYNVKCGEDMCLPQDVENILKSVTDNIGEGCKWESLIVTNCDPNCADDVDCSGDVCTDKSDKDDCTDGCNPECGSDIDCGDVQEAPSDTSKDDECISDNCTGEKDDSCTDCADTEDGDDDDSCTDCADTEDGDDDDSCTDCADTDDSDDEVSDLPLSLEELLGKYFGFWGTPADREIPDQDSITEDTDSTASDSVEVSAYEQEVCDLVNDIRRQYGLSELTVSHELTNVARLKSQDMKDKGYFSHTSPTYGSPFDMMKSFGISYRTAGENIAMGQRTPSEVVNAWMNSDEHRANILNSSYTQIGVGYVENGHYWTQMFIG